MTGLAILVFHFSSLALIKSIRKLSVVKGVLCAPVLIKVKKEW